MAVIFAADKLEF